MGQCFVTPILATTVDQGITLAPVGSYATGYQSEDGKNYLFGARSFSIWDAETMEQLFDSGSGFEEIIAKVLPECFNTTNKDVEVDNRSGKKGLEADIKMPGMVKSNLGRYEIR